MKVVVAPDSWSGFLPSPAVARQAADLLATRGMEPVAVPLADGGEGTTLALISQLQVGTDGEKVSGPSGGEVHVPLVQLTGGVFAETARVVGRSLVEEGTDPLTLSSFGVGELVDYVALQREGPLLLGLGGSAILDGGLGMAQGMGLVLLDAQGNPLETPASAADLLRVHAMEGDVPNPDLVVCGWSDVQTALLDSPRLFGPQKGATPEQVAQVEKGLTQWASVLNAWRRGQGLNEVDPATPGGGAGGGLGFALRGLLDAILMPGAPTISRLLGLSSKLEGAQAMITGEGCMDPTSFSGKVVGHAIERARAQGVPQVGAVVGSIRGPIPPAPVGPDWILACDDFDGESRQDRYTAALSAAANRLETA
jgi:glycerate kinase